MTHQEATHRRSERTQGVPDPEGGQLALPLDLADHHRRPLCSMGRDPRTGYWTGSYRRPPVEAWADWRHVEHNTETSIVGIFLDVDEPGAVHVAADDSLVPWPSWVMTRLGNGQPGGVLAPREAGAYLSRLPREAAAAPPEDGRVLRVHL